MIGTFVTKMMDIMTAIFNWIQVIYQETGALPYVLGSIFAVLIFQNLIFPLIGSTVIGSDRVRKKE